MSGKGGPDLKKFMDKKVMRACSSPCAVRFACLLRDVGLQFPHPCILLWLPDQ